MSLVLSSFVSTNLKPVLAVMGLLIIILGVFMMIPTIYDMVQQTSMGTHFFFSSMICIFIGSIIFIPNYRLHSKISIKQTFLMTVLAWGILPFFAALPLWSSIHFHIDYASAYFESMSGLTTTGGSVYTDIDHLDRGILIWRSLLQWLGGVGIVVMGISLLPLVGIGGMDIFKIEFTNEMEKAFPKLSQIGLLITFVYILLTLLCGIVYYILGMSAFDSVNHALTTLSSGGFGTHGTSFEQYPWPILIAGTVFMLFAATPFILFYHLFFHFSLKPLLKNKQFQGLLSIFILVSLIIVTYLVYQKNWPIMQALLQVGFNVASTLTGTGFASTAYDKWGLFVFPLFLIIMIIGGSAGSASCGMKIFRIQILWSIFRYQISKLINPNAVVSLTYDHRAITRNTEIAVFVVVMSFVAVVFVGTLILIGFGRDILTSLSATIALLGNVGPGLGILVGPNGGYGFFSSTEKWILSFIMLLGRLEILAVFLMFSRKFWGTV